MRWRFDIDDPALARAAWSRIAEPADRQAGALVQAVGPSAALRWLAGAPPERGRDGWLDGIGRAGLDREAAQRGAGPPNGPDGIGQAGLDREAARRGEGAPDGPDGGRFPDAPELFGWSEATGGGLARARERWRVRLEDLDPRRELHALAQLGGTLITPETAGWPTGLADLGPEAPFCLWVRGAEGAAARLDQLLTPAAAVVGARASTSYGEVVTVGLAGDLVARGVAIVSGGAFGIDAAAHRAALAQGGFTVAVMAGGVDRFYPAGNDGLLKAVAQEGAVVSELPPGAAPRRERFLARNRLIAAMALVTVVTEAGWRSGSQRTAAVAAELLRPVAAVPGPVTAASSAGCHRLIRQGVATLVTGADEVRELMAPLGLVTLAEPVGEAGPLDGLPPADRQVLDSLPVRRGATLTALVAASGLSTPQTMAALSRLERAGRAVQSDGGWRKARAAGR
ncbi:MAG: DNA-processing protein DprA [Bifidobacteriaceae bacterium]|jgi:DNA processing protein|nr:DNA-processing protein DprA [Bifidobacteriaceae bacterium]